MKILIAYGDANKYFHLKEFGEALSKLGVEYKLVKDIDYVVGFPSKKIKKWIQSNRKFKKLVEEFVPDAIFVDRQNQFGVEAIKAKIPLFVLLRGHVWDEVKMAKKTLHKGPIIRSALWFRNKTAEKCLLVVDNNKKLLGTLTDGDLRRSILAGIKFSQDIFDHILFS